MQLLRKYSKSIFFRRAKAYFLLCSIFLNSSLSVALADPEGAQVVNGQVSFQQHGYNTTITASDKAIINYSNFDIARSEVVQFIQPNSSASVLNRILSTNPTNINGTLLANGRVFFVNPAGVIFGAGAKVNVNQLVASSLDITDSDFINGQYNFAGGNGSVINRGDITAEKVYLIGKQVVNSGSIHCPDGYVVMVAGDRVFLSEPDSNIRVEIDPHSLSEQTDLAHSEPEVPNEEKKDSAGSRIVLASGDLFSQALSNIDSLAASVETGNTGLVSNTGTIEAKSDTSSGGTIIAKATEIINTGTLDVTGSEGGKVTMEATERLDQFGTIHADGNAGNGGNVELKADDIVTVGSDSLITANAAANGDGGEVIVYSPDTALFHDGATIEAKGGYESGDGGFIEVSGKKYIEVFGQVDASAEVGKPGTFQIDPMNINIQDTAGSMDPGLDGVFTPPTDVSTVSDDAIEEWLNGGTSVEIIATGVDTNKGNITQDENAWIEKTSGGDATIRLIGNDIVLNGGIVSESGKLGVRLDADDNVTLKAEIDTNGGRFTSSGIVFDNTEGSITTAGGTVKFEHSGEMNLGSVDAQDGTVKIAAGVINDSENDPEEDITGGLVKIAAQSGPIGPLDVTASKHMYATTLKEGGDIIISSPGALNDVSAWAAGDVSITIKDDSDIIIGSPETLEEEGNLTINSIVALIGSIDVETVGDITVSNRAEAQTSLRLHSGADGSGDLSFESGAVLASEEIELRAGDGLDFVYDLLEDYMDPDCLIPEEDGLGGHGKNSQVKLTNLEVKGSKKLTIRQDAPITEVPADIQSAPDGIAEIDLHLQSDDGYITCTSAHEWGSISASAYDNITLQGSRNITTGTLKSRTGDISVRSTGGDLIINGDIDAYWQEAGGEDNTDDENCLAGVFDPSKIFSLNNITGGGVELVADNGRIYSSNAGTLNVSITGYSDDLWIKEPEKQVGIELPGGMGRAGIVIISHESLHLGPGSELTTNRKKPPGDIIPTTTDKDDRDGVSFLSGPPVYDRAGDPVDVSIYLASTGRDVIVDSKIHIEDDGGGAMVVDAREKVYFGDVFAEEWVRYGFPRLEIVSRTTQTLDQAAVYESLPGAREMLEGKIPNWIMDEVNKQLASENESGSSIDSGQNDDESVWSKYVLRGGTPGQVLAFVDFFAGTIGGWRTYTDEDLQERSVFKNLFDMFSTRMHNATRRAQMWVKKKPKEPLPLLASTPSIQPRRFNKLIHNGKIEDLRPSEILQKDNTVIIEKDHIRFETLNKDINVVATPLPTQLTTGTRSVLLSIGKIWFWTTDSNSSFEIRTDNDYVIEVIGAASGSVRVEKEKDTNDKTVTIGPILDGQVRVYGPGITLKGVKLDPMAANLKDGKFDDNAKPNLSQAKKEFERIKNGSWPTHVWRLSDKNLSDIIMPR